MNNNMKKNNTAQKTALKVEKISKVLKEGTEKTLRNLLKEAIEDIVDNDDETQETDEPIEDDSFEVQDVETDETSQDTPEDEPTDNTTSDDEGENASTPEEGDDEANEWGDEYDDFKVGDNEYDFTGVDGDLALKIFQSLSDDDQINVKKEEDGKIKVSDGESDAEIVIELTPGEGSAEDDDFDADTEGTEDVDTDIDIELEPDDTDSDFGDNEDEIEPEGEDEIEIDLDDNSFDDEPSEDELNEDLGYTDSYQKDVMPGLKMNEPANKKATNTWDEGIPTGNKKPWAGKHKEKDYKETHTDLAESCQEELEEGSMSTSSQSVAKETHTPTSEPRAKNARQVAKLVHNGGKQLDEAKAQRILEAAKAIQAENKQIKALTGKLRKSLYEAATLNLNYGKIVSLLVNESTTKEEKQSIIERFTNIKTAKEGEILFESIKRELKESNKNNAANVLNERISAESSKTINETPIYQTSTNNKSISLMERMDNLSAYNRKGGFQQVNANGNQILDLMNRLGRI